MTGPDYGSAESGRSVTLNPLLNDSDPDPGDVLTLSDAVVTSGVGSVSWTGNDVTITGAVGFVGTVVVDYRIRDSYGWMAGNQIFVNFWSDTSNAIPFTEPDYAWMYSPAELRLDPLVNDRDIDGDALTITGAAVSLPDAASVVIEGGTVLVIRSVAGFAGTLKVGYTLTDARGAQARGIVTVDVLGPVRNRMPVTVADQATVRVGRTIKVNVLANDGDPDGDAISLVKVHKPSKGSAKRVGQVLRFKAPKSPGTVRVRYSVRDPHGATTLGWLTVKVTRKAKRG